MALSAALLLIACPRPAPAADAAESNEWAQFLGSHRNAISSAKGLNLDWKEKKPKEIWKMPIGGGFSSIACVGDRLYTMVNRDKRDWAVCLDAANGKDVWTVDLAPIYRDKQGQGSGPRATPTYDNGRVYCLHPMGDLFCLNVKDGSEVWKVNIFDESKAKNPAGATFYWGLAGSPLIEGDLVIVQPGGDKDNAVLALNKDNGKPVWSAGSAPGGFYGSPIAFDAAGRRMIVTATGSTLIGLDPKKGTELWSHKFGNQVKCNCATPIWTGEILFYSAAYGAGAVALEFVKDGAKVSVKEKWRSDNLHNQFATSVVHDGYIYGCDGDLGRCALRCLDLKTGEKKWEERKPGKCSLIAAEGRLICMSENGTLRLVELNPNKYVVKGELEDLLTYKTWAAPALAKKRLYVRDEKNLICLDVSKD
jgi:outer membrane protein assembly factor BamB